jgi:hypothetical protein
MKNVLTLEDLSLVADVIPKHYHKLLNNNVKSLCCCPHKIENSFETNFPSISDGYTFTPLLHVIPRVLVLALVERYVVCVTLFSEGLEHAMSIFDFVAAKTFPILRYTHFPINACCQKKKPKLLSLHFIFFIFFCHSYPVAI